jgi:hypothetical protein
MSTARYSAWVLVRSMDRTPRSSLQARDNGWLRDAPPSHGILNRNPHNAQSTAKSAWSPRPETQEPDGHAAGVRLSKLRRAKRWTTNPRRNLDYRVSPGDQGRPSQTRRERVSRLRLVAIQTPETATNSAGDNATTSGRSVIFNDERARRRNQTTSPAARKRPAIATRATPVMSKLGHLVINGNYTSTTTPVINKRPTAGTQNKTDWSFANENASARAAAERPNIRWPSTAATTPAAATMSPNVAPEPRSAVSRPTLEWSSLGSEVEPTEAVRAVTRSSLWGDSFSSEETSSPIGLGQSAARTRTYSSD